MSRLTSPSQTLTDTDVFSISDAHLAQRYRFIREVNHASMRYFILWNALPRVLMQLFLDWRGKLGLRLALFTQEGRCGRQDVQGSGTRRRQACL